MKEIIASAITTIGNIASSNNQRKAAYQNWLSQAVPQYQDVFATYKRTENKSNLIIIGILALLIVVMIIAIALRK